MACAFDPRVIDCTTWKALNPENDVRQDGYDTDGNDRDPQSNLVPDKNDNAQKRTSEILAVAIPMTANVCPTISL